MNWAAIPWQRPFHQSTARFRVAACGRRVGKTIAGAREAFMQLLVPDSWGWIVAPTMDLADKEFRIIWNLTCAENGPKLIPVRRKSERERWILFANGSALWCKSEESPDQLVGEGLAFVIVAEAARLRRKTWDELVAPTLLDRRGWAIFSSTPRGNNWFRDFWLRGADAEFPSWASWQVPTEANPLLDRADIEQLKRENSSTPEVIRQELMAEFVAYGGQVFPEFDYSVHVHSHGYEPGLQTALWCDPGITNPYCVLLVQITPDETIRVLDEIYVTGRVTDQIIDMAEAKWPYALFEGGNPAAGPRVDLTVVVDEAAATENASWRLRGYRAGGSKPGVAQGIEVHHRMLRDPFRQVPPPKDGTNPYGIVPRITFDPRAKNAIEEHNRYHYPDNVRGLANNLSELPVDADNHAISAMRYGYYEAFPALFNEVVPRETYEVITLDAIMRGSGLDPARLRIGALDSADDRYTLGDMASSESRFSLGRG